MATVIGSTKLAEMNTPTKAAQIRVTRPLLFRRAEITNHWATARETRPASRWP